MNFQNDLGCLRSSYLLFFCWIYFGKFSKLIFFSWFHPSQLYRWGMNSLFWFHPSRLRFFDMRLCDFLFICLSRSHHLDHGFCEFTWVGSILLKSLFFKFNIFCTLSLSIKLFYNWVLSCFSIWFLFNCLICMIWITEFIFF